MSTPSNIALIVGSLRRESLNRKTARTLIELAPDSLAPEIVEIGALPLYNDDAEQAAPPDAWVQFRERMAHAEGVIFVTPEYNRSMTGVIKNAIDVGSRPYGKSIWKGKPAGVVSVSPGNIGGFGANQHLRQSLVFLDMPVLQQPEAYIGGAGKLFDESGRMTNEDTRKFLATFMQAYAHWFARVAGPRG